MKVMKTVGAALVFLWCMTALFGGEGLEIHAIPVTAKDGMLPFIYQFGHTTDGRIWLRLKASPRGHFIGRLISFSVRVKDHAITIHDLLAEHGSAKPAESAKMNGEGDFVLSADQIDRAYVAMHIMVESKSCLEIYCAPVALLFRDALKWPGLPNQSADSTPSAGTPAAEQPRAPASVASHL